MRPKVKRRENAITLLELAVPVGRPSSWRPELRGALDQRVDASLMDDIVIAAAELVANALEHGSGEVGVSVGLLGDGAVLVRVSDASDEGPVPSGARVDALRGRGLTMVGALASEWGVDKLSSGKTVWAKFDVPNAGAVETA